MTDVAASPDTTGPDPDRLKMFSFQLFNQLQGAVTAGMVHLGDKLGLYRCLADADGPLTTAELAAATELNERWVREWAYNQGAAKFLTVTADDASADGGASVDGAAEAGELRFGLSAEAAVVFANPEHEAYGLGMFHRFPQTMASLERMPDSFRSGLGHDYDTHGCEGAVGIERSFEPWNRNHLLPTVLPQLSGVVDRLEQGCAVADIGCGAGGAVLLMAAAYPNSTFVGYDISQHALERANTRLADSGLTNVRFVDPRDEPLPSDGSVDVVTTFDCIHDMTDPQGMMHAIRAAIADDGTWLLVDIKARSSYAENVEKIPLAPLMYGISVLSCMSSALSEPGGAGLGTLGLPPELAESMSQTAGFTQFRRLDVDHSINAFYEVRP